MQSSLNGTFEAARSHPPDAQESSMELFAPTKNITLELPDRPIDSYSANSIQWILEISADTDTIIKDVIGDRIAALL